MHAGAPRQDRSLRVVGVDVAGASAVPQFHDRVVNLHGPPELQMRHRTILIGMAAGAIRPESGEFPGDGLGIRCVAAGAAHRRPVIHKRRRCVPIDHRCPHHGPMTRIARQGRNKMPGRLAWSHDAVVAADARRGDAGVIEPSARKGHGALVTSLARSIRNDVVRRLPERGSAVMTARAIRDDSGVIHTGSRERHRALVAVLAGRVGDDVAWRLAERGDAVVAAGAIRGDSRVIHTGSRERHGALVAILAGRVGDDVFRRLAKRGDTVVAGCAATGDARVDGFCGGRG